MNLYFLVFLASIWPNPSPAFMFNRIKGESNQPPSAYFSLIQHLSVFSGTLSKKQKDERYSAERSAKKATLSHKKALHGSPGKSDTRGTTERRKTDQANRPPHGTAWPCHVLRPAVLVSSFFRGTGRILAWGLCAPEHDRATLATRE